MTPEMIREEYLDEHRRWRWVMAKLAFKVETFIARNNFVRHAERSNNPITAQEQLSHLLWMGSEEGLAAADKPTKAMRWACWMQGAMCILRVTNLEECKRLNMRKTWEENR